MYTPTVFCSRHTTERLETTYINGQLYVDVDSCPICRERAQLKNDYNANVIRMVASSLEDVIRGCECRLEDSRQMLNELDY